MAGVGHRGHRANLFSFKKELDSYFKTTILTGFTGSTGFFFNFSVS
jgi:hypothetical protein